MKIKKLTFLLLSVMSASAFAGNYADKGDAVPQDNKDDGSHFYIDVGAAEYYFNQPSMVLPYSAGYSFPNEGKPWSSKSGTSYDSDNWAFNPSITLGYQFLTDNEDLQKIFGQQNAVELRASYFHNTSTQYESYDQPYYVNNFNITGGPSNYSFASDVMTDASVTYDNTYESIGLYYTGNKVVSNQFINSPYVGIDFDYLKQDTSYTTTEYETGPDYLAGGDPLPGVGYDNLSSYYMGLVFGDKATWLFDNHYGAYGKAGAGLYWMHTKLDASQQIVTVPPEGYLNQQMMAQVNLTTTDDQYTFKLNAEIGFNYYFKNNQDPMSPYVTILAGVDYWNDVAYAENPTQEYTAVQIAYASAVNPYAGLQLHIPL